MPNVADNLNTTYQVKLPALGLSEFGPERPLKASIDTPTVHSQFQQTHENQIYAVS